MIVNALQRHASVVAQKSLAEGGLVGVAHRNARQMDVTAGRVRELAPPHHAVVEHLLGLGIVGHTVHRGPDEGQVRVQCDRHRVGRTSRPIYSSGSLR